MQEDYQNCSVLYYIPQLYISQLQLVQRHLVHLCLNILPPCEKQQPLLPHVTCNSAKGQITVASQHNDLLLSKLTLSVGVGRTIESVCLFVCLFAA